FSASLSTQISSLSLHDALPISRLLFPSLRFCIISPFIDPPVMTPLARAVVLANEPVEPLPRCGRRGRTSSRPHSRASRQLHSTRSEEHTSELQSRGHLVCRLLL